MQASSVEVSINLLKTSDVHAVTFANSKEQTDTHSHIAPVVRYADAKSPLKTTYKQLVESVFWIKMTLITLTLVTNRFFKQ